MVKLSSSLAGLMLAAAAAGAAPRTMVATPVGQPVNCIPIASIDSTEVRDDRTIDFILRNRTVYRNALPNSCPQLGFERAFSYATSLSELCSVDIITVLHQGEPLIRGATCGLGQFQPMQLSR